MAYNEVQGVRGVPDIYGLNDPYAQDPILQAPPAAPQRPGPSQRDSGYSPPPGIVSNDVGTQDYNREAIGGRDDEQHPFYNVTWQQTPIQDPYDGTVSWQWKQRKSLTPLGEHIMNQQLAGAGLRQAGANQLAGQLGIQAPPGKYQGSQTIADIQPNAVERNPQWGMRITPGPPARQRNQENQRRRDAGEPLLPRRGDGVTDFNDEQLRRDEAHLAAQQMQQQDQTNMPPPPPPPKNKFQPGPGMGITRYPATYRGNALRGGPTEGM